MFQAILHLKTGFFSELEKFVEKCLAGRLRNDRNTIFEIVKKTSLLLQFFIILHSYKYDGYCAGIHDACDIQIEHINHSII